LKFAQWKLSLTKVGDRQLTEKIKVRINYKSGSSVTMDFTKFIIHTNILGVMTSIEWEVPKGGLKPLRLGIDEIESIFQIRETDGGLASS
jgi:hypothetical protein